jgi:hypothetical protein
MERAARQQGSSLLRENSSNGGKAIRTFWLHTRGGGERCQEQFLCEISILLSITYKEECKKAIWCVFALLSPFLPGLYACFQGVLSGFGLVLHRQSGPKSVGTGLMQAEKNSHFFASFQSSKWRLMNSASWSEEAGLPLATR